MRERRATVDFVANVDVIVALVRADSPDAQDPGPRAELLLDQLAIEDELTTGDVVVRAELLTHAVDVDLERRPDVARKLGAGARLRHQRPPARIESTAMATRSPRSLACPVSRPSCCMPAARPAAIIRGWSAWVRSETRLNPQSSSSHRVVSSSAS